MPSLIDRFISADGKQEWRENWPVVLSAMVGFGISSIHMYSMGVMIPSLEAEFGWSRTKITFGFLIISMIVVPLAPIVGIVIDRFGPRRVAIFGTALYCTAVATLSLAQQPIWTWWLLWVFIAFGHLFLTATVWVAAISSLFHASRGLALAVSLSATGLVSFGGPIFTYFLIDQFGWRLAYVAWATFAAGITLPLLCFCFTSRSDQERKTPNSHRRPHSTSITGLSRRDGMMSPTFYKLTAVTFMMAIATVALVVNLVPILLSGGINIASAAAIAGIVGIFQIVGRVTGGVFLDHFDARLVGAASMALPIVSCLLMIVFAGSAPAAVVAIILFGLALGAELDVIAYLAGRFFGIRNFASIFGVMVGLMTLGAGLGPVLASVVYDYTGSYTLVLWGAIPLALCSAALLSTLGEYPRFSTTLADV